MTLYILFNINKPLKIIRGHSQLFISSIHMQHVLKAHFLKACDVTTAHGLTVYQTQTLIEPDNKNLFLGSDWKIEIRGMMLYKCA